MTDINQVLDHGDMPGLSKVTVVDIWVSSADAVRVLDKGYKIIHAAGDYFYLVRPRCNTIDV
jgi:hexosaminidase